MKTKLFIAVSLMVLVTMFLVNSRNTKAQNITLIPGTIQVSQEVENAVLSALNSAGSIPQGDLFAITDDTVFSPEWHRVSVVGLAGIQPGDSWNDMNDGVWFSLVLVHEENGNWQGAVRGTQAFHNLIWQMPDDLMDQKSKASLDPVSADQLSVASVEIPHLPFMGGKSLRYGPAGLHWDGQSGFESFRAIDLNREGGNSETSDTPNEALAATSGSVNWICTIPNAKNQVAIQVGNYMYRHLVRNDWLTSRTYIHQGQRLGNLISGPIPEGTPCGWADQLSGTSHIHFVFPPGGSSIDGYTLNWNTGVWSGSSGFVVPSIGLFVSRNTNSECEMSQSNGVTFFEHKDCSGGTRQYSNTGGPHYLSGFNNIASSIDVEDGWSALVEDDSSFWAGKTCVTKDKWDLSKDLYEQQAPRSMNDSISQVTIFHDSTCGQGAPVCPFGADISVAEACVPPTPTPIPTPGVTPTPTSQPIPSGWNVRFYSSENECSFPDCNPGSAYINTTMVGQTLNLNFSDGRVMGQGNDHWGSIWKQTINFSPGSYVFHANHDDGLKVFIGNTNIMDVGGSESGNITCPAKYLSGPTEITLIWKNTGGPASLNLWWDQNVALCNPTPTPVPPSGPTNVWVWRDVNNKSRLTVENGSQTLKVYVERKGQPVELITPSWYMQGGVTNGWGWFIPDDVISLRVDANPIPIISGDSSQMEWINDGDDPRWALRKSLVVWKDHLGRTRVNYLNHFSTYPEIQYRLLGESLETRTTSLWMLYADGISAVLPEGIVDSFNVQGAFTLIPKVEESADDSWYVQEGSSYVYKKSVFPWVEPDGSDELCYYKGSPVPVLLVRYGHGMEISSTGWYQDGSYWCFPLPEDVLSVRLTAGPIPEAWYPNLWRYSADDHRWLEKKSVWVSRDEDSTTRVTYLYGSPLPVHYFIWNQSEQITTPNWYPVADGIEFVVPADWESLLVEGAPVPIIGAEHQPEWHNAYEDHHWVVRKFLKVSYDGIQTKVTYWHRPSSDLPNLRYWQSGSETVTKGLWYGINNGESIEAVVPEGVDSFKVDEWIVPLLVDLAPTKWVLRSNLDPWVVLKTSNPPPQETQIFLPIVVK